MHKKLSLLFLPAFLFFFQDSQAKIWRVNNTPGVVADFTEVSTAVADSRVQDNDTLYVEGSAKNYVGFTLNKKLVIIGTGYLLETANGNPGLQADTLMSGFGGANILIDSLGSGSHLIGLADFSLGNAVNGSGADNITVSRCNIRSFSRYHAVVANYVMDGWVIKQCYVTNNFLLDQFVVHNFTLQNNIIGGVLQASNSLNDKLLIRNNVFRSSVSVYEAYFANNIISQYTFSAVNSVLKNNLAIGTPAGFASFVGTNGNKNGFTDAAMFVGSGSSKDGYFQLASGSPAKGAGLTVGSVVNPDAGAFGGTDPYRLSGIPNIPTIYELNVPAAIPSGSSTMPVTFSTRSNN